MIAHCPHCGKALAGIEKAYPSLVIAAGVAGDKRRLLSKQPNWFARFYLWIRRTFG